MVIRSLGLACLFVGSFYGQTVAPKALPSNVQELKLESKLMARQMPYRVVFPADYSDPKTASTRYSVIYLLHGLTGRYDNWVDRTKVADYATRHKFLIVTPDGGNSWYSDSVANANDKFESHIVRELIPAIEARFRTLADRDHRIVAGLSMGGFGAIKFGLKYPEMFALVGSFSGALGAVDYDAGPASGGTPAAFETLLRTTLAAAFGPRGGEPRKANDLFRVARELTPEKVKALPYVYLACGTEDLLFQSNRDFNAILIEKKVPHEYREHPGGHDWIFWDAQVREFLALAERRTSK